MEYFRTYSEAGEKGPLVARAEVHKNGLWHKAVQVLVFNRHKELLIQHRSDSKDLYAGLWDFSVGEHLLPDEDEAVGAVRGLHEELGVEGCRVTLLGEPLRIECRGDGFIDREIQQSFYALSEGPFSLDEEEVQAARFVGEGELSVWFSERPEDFTPWFVEQWPVRREHAVALGLFG